MSPETKTNYYEKYICILRMYGKECERSKALELIICNQRKELKRMNTARSLCNQIKKLLIIALGCCLIGASFGFVSYLLERMQ